MSALAAGVLEALVDQRTGLVRSLSDRPIPPRMPSTYRLTASRISDSRQFTPWASDSAGAGYAFDDEASATAAAVGEAVERYCANLVPDRLVRASYDELTARGEPALDPAAVALFSSEQHADPRFPWQPFNRDVLTGWTAGRCTLTDAPISVPACLVWPSYATSQALHRAGRPQDRPLAPVLQAGLATGPTLEAAEQSALLEVLERDAMALAWHGRGGLVPLQVDEELAVLAAGPLGLLHTRFILFTSEFGVPVVGALIRDLETGYLALGTGCRTNVREAALKALGEALQLTLLLAEYDDPDGAFAAAADQPASPLRPWRADRAYLDSYAPDLSDVRDYGCHLQLALDPAFQQRFEAELEEAWSSPSRPLSWVQQADLGATASRLHESGHPILAVDVTTDDVRRVGLHVTRVLVPGLVGNSAAGFPLLGGERQRALLAGRTRRTLPLPH